MRLRSLLLCAPLLCFRACATANAAPSLQSTTQPATSPSDDGLRHLNVDGRDRSYLLHVPRTCDKSKPTALVIAFHGATMNAASMERFSGLSGTSDSDGFILAYPNGTGRGSNEHLFFNANFPAGAKDRPDDVAFTSKLIDDVEKAYDIDPKRIYATGMSNGGMMCYRLAAELSDRIAAIAPVSGTMVLPDPQPKQPIPIIHFHGTDDKIVPFDGPRSGSRLAPQFKSVDETISTWATLDGCPAEPQVEKLPDTAHDGTAVTRKTYGPGKNDAEIVLYVIDGGGHNWPGRGGKIPILGRSTANLNADQLIWAFFQKHPMK